MAALLGLRAWLKGQVVGRRATRAFLVLGSVRHPARGELLDDGRAESAQVVR